MGTIGHGYGSEWHLLRWMGRHRDAFNQAVRSAMNHQQGRIHWLDSPFASHPKPLHRDREHQGLAFLPSGHPARTAWGGFWPARGNAHNWDAVGTLHTDSGTMEWLLVEAKAHTGEIQSSCGAAAKGGLPQIERSLDAVKAALGVPAGTDWLQPYYQYANRLAALHFLLQNNVSARLLFVYFCGDSNPSASCPATEQQWRAALDAQHRHLALPRGHLLADRVHSLFLGV